MIQKIIELILMGVGLGGGLKLLEAIISLVGKKWGKNWINANDNRRKAAIMIAEYADRITDGLVQAFPDKKWDDVADEIVDMLIKSFGLSAEVASRIAKVAVNKKLSKEA